MIQIKTDFPVAVDSDDHKHPEGVYYDNNVDMDFVRDIEARYGREISFMDLGCAGGALTCTMFERGHTAVGLEGSDHCLHLNDDMVREVGRLPAGFHNWVKYGNKILFTADVTKPYDVLENDAPLQFDLITCWDVMEHFNPDQVDPFMLNVQRHLKPGGILVASIALFDAGRHEESKNTPEGLNYHKSVFPREWWLERTNKYLTEVPYPFGTTNRPYIMGNPGYLLYVGQKA